MSEGFITKIDVRTTRFGDYHDIYVDNKNLGGSKFPPKGVAVGDYVTYEVEKNAKGYDQIKQGSLAKTAAPAGVTPMAPPAASTIGLDRQDVISRQSALNSAIAFLSLLQTEGALPVAKSLTSEKKADKLEAILMEYVGRFYKSNTMSDYEIADDEAAAAVQSWDEQA